MEPQAARARSYASTSVWQRRIDWNRWATATTIAEWFGCAFKRMKHLCCNNACLAALCRKACVQESSVLASSHAFDMLQQGQNLALNTRASSTFNSNIQLRPIVPIGCAWQILQTCGQHFHRLGHSCVCAHTSTLECGVRSHSLYTRSCNCACHGLIRQCAAQVRVRSRARV